MATDALTPAERNALKWVEFSERMDALNVKYENGDTNSHDAWKAVQHNYHLIKGVSE